MLGDSLALRALPRSRPGALQGAVQWDCVDSMPLPCYSCVHVLVLLISCDSAAASQLDEEATVLTDKEKLAKLHGEGLDDVDDFMDSFGRGQLATDDVKCDLCKHLLFDLNAGVSNLRADGVAEVCSSHSSACSQPGEHLSLPVKHVPDSRG